MTMDSHRTGQVKPAGVPFGVFASFLQGVSLKSANPPELRAGALYALFLEESSFPKRLPADYTGCSCRV